MGTRANRADTGDKAGNKISTWLIIGLVAVALVAAFWLFDASGADPTGNEVGETTNQGTDDEAPDVDFGEPADGEGPDIESTP